MSLDVHPRVFDTREELQDIARRAKCASNVRIPAIFRAC